MTKQVIVVVHGVGVKQAGLSSDLLAAVLQADDGGSTEPRLPPHSTDDYVLLENVDYDSSNKASVFPARIRRYRCYEGSAIKHERVIADFYWGDVTAFGASVLNVVLAYFRVAMGMSHAIRENAKEVYPGDDWKDRWSAKLARGAALTIHGPVIAINIVLLVGLVIAAALASLFTEDATTPNVFLLRLQILVITATAIAGGLLLTLRGGSFLYRHLMSWIALTGAMFLLVGLPELFGFNGASQWVDSLLTKLECSVFPEDSDSFARCRYSGIHLVGLRLTIFLNAAWVLVFIQVIAVWALGFFRSATESRPETPNLVAPAIGLMSLLWFFLSAALWAAALKLPETLHLRLQQENITGALIAINAALLVVGLLGLAVAGVFLRKRDLKGAEFRDPQAYMANEGARAAEYADRFRLLIAPWMLRVLCFFLPLVLAISLLIYIPAAGKLLGQLASWTVPIIFGVLAAGSFAVYTLKAEFTAGLGILADVLAYINNSSWMSGAAKDIYKIKEPPRRTWLERLLGLKTNDVMSNANPRGYWLRRRIHDRLDVLVRSLIRDEAPDRLDIVSHSQGTVIAIDLIDHRGGDWMNELGKAGDNRHMRLVTMGSPYTHLYGCYFPSSFPTVARRPNLGKRDPLRPDGGAVLSAWINIFRIDDFVGTHVGKGDWPKEFPVAPNGHTNYWVDRSVAEKLRDFLKL